MGAAKEARDRASIRARFDREAAERSAHRAAWQAEQEGRADRWIARYEAAERRSRRDYADRAAVAAWDRRQLTGWRLSNNPAMERERAELATLEAHKGA